MDKVNLESIKEQAQNFLAALKLLTLDEQTEAICLLLAAINAYLKNAFAEFEESGFKEKLRRHLEVTRETPPPPSSPLPAPVFVVVESAATVEEVVRTEEQAAPKTEDELKPVLPLSSPLPRNLCRFGQLYSFPFFIRGGAQTKCLYRTRTRDSWRLSPTALTKGWKTAEFRNLTAGLNHVNRLQCHVKCRVVLTRIAVPKVARRKPSRDSLPLMTYEKQAAAPSSLDNESSDDDVASTVSADGSHSMEHIDYDELLLQPDLGTAPPVTGTIKPPKKKARRRSSEEKRAAMKLLLNMPPTSSATGVDASGSASTASSLDDPNKSKSKKRKTYPCLFCKKTYRSRKSLMIHFEHHPGYCPDCGEKYGYTPAEIIDHNRRFHINERPIICETCGESFTRNQQYQIHLQNHERVEVEEPPPKYACSECNIVFQNQKTLEKHVQESNHKQDRRLCDICGCDFETNTQLLQHLRRAHKPKAFPCGLCGKEFSLKCNLDRHMRTLHSTDPSKKFICEICGAEYTSQHSLNEHTEVTHSKSKVYACEMCDKTFFTKRLLKVHAIVHSEYRPFQCNQCDQAYKRRSHLDRHVHFAHNKNGKVSLNGGEGLMPPPPGMGKPGRKKKDKTATAAAVAVAAMHHAVPPPPPPHPAYDATNYGYEMQGVAYNNLPDAYNHMMDPHQMGAGGDPNAGMHHMYNSYGAPATNADDGMVKYEHHHAHHHQQGAPQPSHLPPGTNDFANQYYLQENAVSWDNMVYNNGGGTAPGATDQMGGYGVVGDDYMQVTMNKQTPVQHQPPSQPQDGQLMNIPNSDLLSYQDNMWGAAGATSAAGNTYNNIGNILTNLELIGNNSNFENSFDIVTSQSVYADQDLQQQFSIAPPPPVTGSGYHHDPMAAAAAGVGHSQAAPPPAVSMNNQYAMMSQQAPPPQHQYVDMQPQPPPPQQHNHTITDISNISPYKMKNEPM